MPPSHRDRFIPDVVVVAGGPEPEVSPAEVGVLVGLGVPVVAADRGLDHALRLGLAPTVVVGDLDSVSSASLGHARATGVEIVEHPSDKDATDLELALDVAVDLAGTAPGAGPSRLLVIGSGAGRLDHLVVSSVVLARPGLGAWSVQAWWGRSLVAVGRPGAPVEAWGTPGDHVSLIAVGGVAEGVTTTGLRYPLTDDRLEPWSGRGQSNVFLTASAGVDVGDGTVLVLVPGGGG